MLMGFCISMCLFVIVTKSPVISFSQGKLPTRPPLVPRQSPLTAEEWESLRGADGRISAVNERHFRARVFAGVSPRYM